MIINLSPFLSCLPAAVFITILCVILANCLKELLAGHAAVVAPCVILTLLCIVCLIIICRQPESKEALTFKVTITDSILSTLLVTHF